MDGVVLFSWAVVWYARFSSSTLSLSTSWTYSHTPACVRSSTTCVGAVTVPGLLLVKATKIAKLSSVFVSSAHAWLPNWHDVLLRELSAALFLPPTFLHQQPPRMKLGMIFPLEYYWEVSQGGCQIVLVLPALPCDFALWCQPGHLGLCLHNLTQEHQHHQHNLHQTTIITTMIRFEHTSTIWNPKGIFSLVSRYISYSGKYCLGVY